MANISILLACYLKFKDVNISHFVLFWGWWQNCVIDNVLNVDGVSLANFRAGSLEFLLGLSTFCWALTGRGISVFIVALVFFSNWTTLECLRFRTLLLKARLYQVPLVSINTMFLEINWHYCMGITRQRCRASRLFDSCIKFDCWNIFTENMYVLEVKNYGLLQWKE